MSKKKYLFCLASTVLLLVTAGGCSSKEKYDFSYFKDGEFFNQQNPQKKSLWSYLAMRLTSKQQSWPESVSLKKATEVPPSRSKKLRIYYVNHASFLIQIDDLNILTDPIFSERASPISWLGPRRVIEPGIRREDLPPIDFIVISHDHYDHLDFHSVEWLVKRDQAQVFMGLGVSEIFENSIVAQQSHEMKWWQSENFKGASITFTPAQHFSGRGLFDRNSTLWGSFVLQAGGLKIYFAGDTGYSDHFKEIYAKVGAVDLALLPIGAYDPSYFMAYNHMNPEEAVQAHLDLKAKNSLAMHWGTFQMTNESRLEPKERLLAEIQRLAEVHFQVPETGDCFSYLGDDNRVLDRCEDRIP